MSVMTTMDAANWAARNPNSVGGAIAQMMISERGMAQNPVGTEVYNMHRQIYDHNMGLVTAAREEAETEQSIMDIEQAKATCDCQPGEPCCLTSGEVSDSTDASRKVTWPITDDQSRLYVIAKDVEGASLVGKVKSKVIAIKDCTAIRPIQRGINTNNPIGDRNPLPEAETEQSVQAPRSAGLQSLGQGLLPGEFVVAMVALEALMAAGGAFSERTTVNYTPEMCQPENGMGATLMVQAVPKMDLEAEATAFIAMGLRTSGVTASTGLTGKITGNIGAQKIELEGEATAESPDTTKRSIAPVPENSSEGGAVGFVANMLGKMSAFAAKGSPKSSPSTAVPRNSQDLVDAVAGTGIEVKVELKFTAKTLELKPVTATPDLELDLSQFEVSLTLTVTGTLDLIELAIMMLLSPAASRTVQSARAQMAKGEAVRGEAKCEVTLSAEGSLTHKYNAGFAYLCSANGDSGFRRGEAGGEFGGKVTVTGTATISIHAEAQVWIAQAQAGASGAVHTAWIWEMQKIAGKRQKRYRFDGLRARATMYAELGVVTDDSAPIGVVEPENGRSTGPDDGLSADVSGSAEQVLGRLGGPASQNWREPYDGEKIIMPPSVPVGTDPPWEDY